MQVFTDGATLTLLANYGFAGIMVVLLWRYITRQQKQHNEALAKLNATLGRVEKQLERLEREHEKS